MNTYKKLAQGIWGCVIESGEIPEVGDEVTLTTKRGKEKYETIQKVIREIDGKFLCSIVQTGRSREIKEGRIEQRKDWALKAGKRSQDHYEQSGSEISQLPLGQPILVGHHSEKRHRRMLEKSHGHMDKSVAEQKKAVDHIEKAEGIEFQVKKTIFSDDVDAIERLREKMAFLEKKRGAMKKRNKNFKAWIKENNIDDKTARNLQIMYWYGNNIEGLPFLPIESRPILPASLTNAGAEIRRIKKRIENIERYL